MPAHGSTLLGRRRREGSPSRTYNSRVPPEVSVVIPNYNRAAMVGAAVRSALAQEEVEVEVIVCDDGSDDASATVVRELADRRVRWSPGERSGGPSRPRNRGVADARAPWVAFLDSDDIWYPSKLVTQLRLLEATQGVASSTNAYRCRPGADLRPLLYPSLPPVVVLEDQLRGNLLVTSSVLVRTDVLRALGGFPERAGRALFEDYALWLRLVQEHPVHVVDHPLVDYRDDAATSLRGGLSSELLCTFNSLRDFRRWRAESHPPLRTTPREWSLGARQLSGLVSVRSALAARSRTMSSSGAT